MAKPVTRTFDGSKQQIMEIYPQVLDSVGMQLSGCNTRLGIISFHKSADEMLYAHIVEQEDNSTTVSIAPGLSYLGERDQSEVPTATINRLMDVLENIIKNGNKYSP